MLTPRQREALRAIEAFAPERGRGPSFIEFREIAGFASKGAAHGMMERLEARGAIRRGVGRNGPMEIVRGERPVGYFKAEAFVDAEGRRDTRLRLIAVGALL